MGGNFYAVTRRPWHTRLWSRLGFGHAHVNRDAIEGWEGFAPGYMATRTVVGLDWLDRLRVLVSGRLNIETLTRTDVPVGACLSLSSTRVLPPGVR